MEKGEYRDAVKLVIRLRESGLNPETYSYLVAVTAVVKELNEIAKALRKLKGFAKSGFVAELDEENIRLVEKYQSDLVEDGIQLSRWVIEEGNSSVLSLVREKLLAMYICVGNGLEAERQLWEMKLLGKNVERYLYDIVLAICASQGQKLAVSRLLVTLESSSPSSKKKTLSWLLRGYIKAGNFEDAAETITKMLDSGLHPNHLDRIAVVQGLRRTIRQPGNMEIYLGLCKRLSDADLIGPCLIYMYIKKYRLWITKMI
ncbi:unnamed protein product [Amaranthus hypochondriacus]